MSTLLRNVSVTIAALSAFGALLTTPATASTSTQDSPTGHTSGNASIQCDLDFTEPGINIRGLPNTNSVIRGQGNPGDCVTYHRATTGEEVNCGAWSTIAWYDITNLRTGVRGWVAGCYIA